MTLRREVPVRVRRTEPPPFGPALGALILVVAYAAAVSTVILLDGCWSGHTQAPVAKRAARPPAVRIVPCQRLAELVGELPEEPDTAECDDESTERYYWCRWVAADQDATSLRSWANNALAWCLP